MKTELIDKLALIYVEKNLDPGMPATDALRLYQTAQKDIQKALGDQLNKHVNDGTFSF